MVLVLQNRVSQIAPILSNIFSQKLPNITLQKIENLQEKGGLLHRQVSQPSIPICLPYWHGLAHRIAEGHPSIRINETCFST